MTYSLSSKDTGNVGWTELHRFQHGWRTVQHGSRNYFQTSLITMWVTSTGISIRAVAVIDVCVTVETSFRHWQQSSLPWCSGRRQTRGMQQCQNTPLGPQVWNTMVNTYSQHPVLRIIQSALLRGRPVQSNTISTSQGNIQSYCKQLMHEDNLYTTMSNQICIHTGEWTGEQQSEKTLLKVWHGSAGFEPGFS